MRIFYTAAAACLLSSAASAQVVSTGGRVNITVAAVTITAPSNLASGTCSGYVALVPNNLLSNPLSAIGLVSLLVNGGAGVENQSARGTFTDRTFNCALSVPYRWENVDLGAMQMAVAYTVQATDPTGLPLGKKKQIIQVMPVPATNGAITNFSVAPKI